MALDLGKFNAEMRARATTDPLFNRMALMFEQIQDSINQTNSAIGTDATGHLDPPPPPQALTVKAASGLVHATVTDTSTRSRGLNYFLEYSTNPAFTPQTTHTFHLGAGREHFTTLPALNDAGDAQSWYARAYSMYPGSTQRSSHQIYGNLLHPTPISVGGTTQLTPLAAVGSGTTTQSGQGFGTAQVSND